MIQAALHLTIAALLCLLTGGAPPPVFLLCLILGLLPDIDTPKSIIGSFFRPLSEAIERRVGHRTATHSLLAIVAVAGLAYLLLPTWWVQLAGSYGSHVLVDLMIGKQGVLLFWPGREWQALTNWRDDGPAPRRLLALTLPLLALVVVWPQLRPVLELPLSAAVAVANPIATSTSQPPTRTPQPALKVSFELPPGVGLSSVSVRAGDAVVEGQLLARWALPTPTLWPTPTMPPAETPPAAATPPAVASSPPADQSSLTIALAEVAIAEAAPRAEREALRIRHEREATEILRKRDQAALALSQLQPLHEREQAEAQHAVDAAAQELAAAQSELSLATGDAVSRAESRVRDAQVALTRTLDAQSRMRTEQGVEREQLTAELSQAQADLDAFPAHQASERGALESRLAAELAHARGRANAAREALAAEAARAEGDVARLSATAAAQAHATATAAAQVWQQREVARVSTYETVAAATAAALPTSAPHQVVSRVSGRVARVTAEQSEGHLMVTIDIVTP